MARKDAASMFAVALVVGIFASVPISVQSIGNNLQSRRESRVVTGMRIVSPDPQALSALLINSGYVTAIDIGGTDQLASLAASFSNAVSWVQANIRPYYPAVNIKYIVAGNKVQGGDTQNIVPAMRNLNAALTAAGLTSIKVSTAIGFDAVANYFPPSAGMFRQSYMTDVAWLLASTGAPLLVNVYPFFACRDNPNSIKLNYAMFQPSTTVKDKNNGLTYICPFDAMVDAVYAALKKAGVPGVRVVMVSESGWPSASRFTATVDNSRTYKQGLINHVNGNRETLKRRGVLETRNRPRTSGSNFVD